MGLKVPVDVLNQIEQECEGHPGTKHKLKVCEYWLKCCPEDTWEEVIVTLMRTGYIKKIRKSMWNIRNNRHEGKN